MKASSVNTEIILNLSPVNNINDSLRRFGIDEGRSDILVLKVCQDDEQFSALAKKLEEMLESTSVKLTEEILFTKFDAARFKKLFKLQGIESQEALAQGAIESSLVRGL